MKKSHSGFWVGLAVVLAAAVYSAIVFLAKVSWDTTSWILYGFTMAAFLLMAIQCIAVSRSGSGLVLDTALSKVTTAYFGLQLVFGGIVWMCFANVPTAPAIICEIILLTAYLIVAFLVYAAQSHSAAQDYNDQKTVQKLRLLESDIQGFAEEAINPEIKQALKKLAEEIHYSDVVSLPGLADVEGRIAQNVAILQDELSDENADPLSRIETIRRLIKERDRTAAILKR